MQVEPVGALGHGFAVQHADDDVEALVHHAALIGGAHADLHRVVHQRTGPTPNITRPRVW